MRVLVLSLILCCLARSLSADAVRMKCWLVSSGVNTGGHTAETVSNMVNGVNEMYMQVCMRFIVDSISYTNDAYLANVHLTNHVQWTVLSSIEQNTGKLELYFVPILEGGATAFHTPSGIVVGPSANVRTLSHEIGHACGLPDIYMRHRGTAYRVLGAPNKGRMPDDWGWYPSTVTHAEVVKRLLMYGYRSDVKADISYGDIYGLHYTNSWNAATRRWDRVWLLDQAPIGVGTHGNRNPMSQ